MFDRTGVIADVHCGNRNFRRFWLLWPWPWPDDLRMRTWPVVRGDMPHVQIWTSYVRPFESYRLTDRHTDTTKIIHHASSRVVQNVYRCNDDDGACKKLHRVRLHKQLCQRTLTEYVDHCLLFSAPLYIYQGLCINRSSKSPKWRDFSAAVQGGPKNRPFVKVYNSWIWWRMNQNVQLFVGSKADI